MTLVELIGEGRKLQKPCSFLRPTGTGPIAALWYERDPQEIAATGYRHWLTVDSRFIPQRPPELSGYLSVFSEERRHTGGRVVITPSWPERIGISLYAQPASVLPPIDIVFEQGSAAITEWLAKSNWKREFGPHSNFKDVKLVQRYEEVWSQEHPLFFDPDGSEIYALLGGWQWPDPGAKENPIEEQLLITTLRDAEPWVEAWYGDTNGFDVLQRIT